MAEKKKKRPDQRATFPKLQPDPIGGALHPDYMRDLQNLLNLGQAPPARGVGMEIFEPEQTPGPTMPAYPERHLWQYQEKPLFHQEQRPGGPFVDPHRLQMIQDLMRTEKLLKGI